MIHYLKNSNIGVVLLLLLTIYGVSSYPHPSESNAEDNDDKQNGAGAITGELEINEEAIEGNIELPSDIGNNGDRENENFAEGANNEDEGALSASVEINDENIEGNIKLPNNVDDQLLEGGKSADSKQPMDDIATGSIEMNDKNIEEYKEISDDEFNQPSLEGKQSADNKQPGDGFVMGSIEMNDKNIEGHIELPGGEDDQLLEGEQSTDNKQPGNDFVTGSIEMNDKNIEGHIELPDSENKHHLDEQSAAHGIENDAISGNIEINDKNIEGSIDLPTDNDEKEVDSENGDRKQPGDDFITGSIEINDKNIEGHMKLPEVKNRLEKGNQVDGNDVLSASVELGNENIGSRIELPYNYGNDAQNEFSDTGDFSGSVEIKDDGIEGHIKIPGENDQGGNDENDDQDELPDVNVPNATKRPSNTDNSCWMKLNSKHHMDALDKLDTTYNAARQKYQADVGKEFDKNMMEVLLTSKGKAPRAIHQAEGDPSQIPAGINLGGTCMMRMEGSVLFFHRMKLRNSTRFTVNFLNTDLMNMELIVRLSLNDLHLKGAYERLTTDRNPSMLFYVPNIGEIEVLLKNVMYKMEGHLRMLNNRLIIELVNSDLLTKDIIMTYVNLNDSTPIKLQPRNIEDFLERLKADLDCWLKDYFNDYLMYFGIVGKGPKVLEYEKKKTIRANQYADNAVKSIKTRIQDLGLSTVKLPHFTIFSILNTNIKIQDGVVRGLDSIYRRSVATTKKQDKIRQLDFNVGFSQLKVEYKYEAHINIGSPPIAGKLILSANEITAHVEISQVAEPETVDILFDTIMQIKPESLTVEGPANRLIANFKALLENPIVAIMTNTLKHNIKMMKTLTRCDPYIYGKENRIYKKELQLQNAQISDNADNNIDKEEDKLSEVVAGNSDLSPEDNNGGETEDNKEWSDYVFSKNDSLEIEVPVKGNKEKFKLHHNEKVVLTKVDT